MRLNLCGGSTWRYTQTQLFRAFKMSKYSEKQGLSVSSGCLKTFFDDGECSCKL